jgi:hypothetical protein
MPVRILIAALAFGGAVGSAATLPRQGPEVQMIVTSADHMTHDPAVLTPMDVVINDATITGFVPFEAGRDLDLYFVIDDSADYAPAQKLEELRGFIKVQPAGVRVGVAYIHDGALRLAEKPTIDHELAARALRAPSGGKTIGPWRAVADLIANWPATAARREIIMLASGIYTPADATASVNTEAAIRDAERAGVIVYALYNPNSDYISQDWNKVDAGLINLSSLAYETGGEAYFIGHTPVSSVEPFLADITEHLAHQYLVKFRMAPRAQGAFRNIFVEPGTPERELMKPDKIWVPGFTN